MQIQPYLICVVETLSDHPLERPYFFYPFPLNLMALYCIFLFFNFCFFTCLLPVNPHYIKSEPLIIGHVCIVYYSLSYTASIFCIHRYSVTIFIRFLFILFCCIVSALLRPLFVTLIFLNPIFSGGGGGSEPV